MTGAAVDQRQEGTAVSMSIVQDDDGRFWVEEPGEFDPPDRWGPFATEERAREALRQMIVRFEAAATTPPAGAQGGSDAD